MFLKGQYQVAYVTHDLDAAVDIFENQYGCPKFRYMGGGEPGSGLKVSTPTGEDELSVKAAVAKIDKMFVEIIEPVSGPVGFYTDFINPSKPMQFHHIAMLTNDIEGMRRESEAMGRPAVVWGDFPGGSLLYVDARATLGHYLEYVATDA